MEIQTLIGMLSLTTGLVIVATGIHICAYVAYVWQVLRKEIRPTGASWLMFAYGTALLFWLEWGNGANWRLLLLPGVCAASSLYVAWYCYRRGGGLLPKHTYDWIALGLDVLITLIYFSSWTLLKVGVITADLKDTVGLVLLICWNVGILTAFFPLLREVYHHPYAERSLPWGLWTVAFGVLLVATILEEGGVNELALYPFTSMLVHGFVAHHAREHRRKRMLA